MISLPEYSERFLRIITKAGKLSPLTLNPFQLELERVKQEFKKEGKPLRVIVLKARQLGISTYCCADLFSAATTTPFITCLTAANDSDNTNKLFSIQKAFYDFLPDEFKPMKRYSNVKELVFENPDENERGEIPGLKSQIRVETAGKKRMGMSGTVSRLHLSEFAFYEDAPSVVTSALQAVPYTRDSAVWIESTANGMEGSKGEEFYIRCMEAMEGKGEYAFVFFPWWQNPEYERTPPEGFTPDSEERDLLERFPEMSLRKIAWRRFKIQNEMGKALLNPVLQFKQEYPATPEEAFISSGRPVFDAERLQAEIERAKQLKPVRGRFDSIGEFQKDPSGEVKLFKKPEAGKSYAIGADVAEGLEGGDDSAFCVIDSNWEQVASFRGQMDPDLFGKLLASVGRFYNRAQVGSEVNNHGHATLAALKGTGYQNIYYRMIKDEHGDKYTKKLGWITTAKSKTKMMDDFCAAYRDRSLTIRDADLLREMLRLRLEPDGDVVLNGRDLVVSACIALQAIPQASSVGGGSYYPEDHDYQPREVRNISKRLAKLKKGVSSD